MLQNTDVGRDPGILSGRARKYLLKIHNTKRGKRVLAPNDVKADEECRLHGLVRRISMVGTGRWRGRELTPAAIAAIPAIRTYDARERRLREDGAVARHSGESPLDAALGALIAHLRARGGQ